MSPSTWTRPKLTLTAQYFEQMPRHPYREHVGHQWSESVSPPPYNAVQYEYPTHLQPMPTAMPPSAFHQHHHQRFPDAGDYLRQQLNLPPGSTVNLWSVPEPTNGEKPSIPLPMLIKLAIYGSERKRLTLQEIYTAVEQRFTWFREHSNDVAWKVRFRRVYFFALFYSRMSAVIIEFDPTQPVTEQGVQEQSATCDGAGQGELLGAGRLAGRGV
jgi:hypothetical protein